MRIAQTMVVDQPNGEKVLFTVDEKQVIISFKKGFVVISEEGFRKFSNQVDELIKTMKDERSE
jgi:hypothetical protein